MFGFTGLESVGKTLLAVDAGKRTPVQVAIEPVPTIVRSDSMRLPDKYHSKVLLITDQRRGVVVLRSKDIWKTAEYLGLVPNDATLPPGALIAAVSQMADRI